MIRDTLITYSRLGRLRISFAAALSAATGNLLAAYSLRTEILLIAAGVFLLSCGASGLNQYQERDTDALMDRTKERPLPSGRITAEHALLFSAGCILGGLVLLFLFGGYISAAGGLFAIAWYNGLYTCMKRKTAYAFLPGALVGAVPPALGWLSGGGGYEAPLLALCIFFYLWQVPHFWLCAARYRNEYAGAGIPSVASMFSERQLGRIVFIWIAALAVSSLFFVPSGLALNIWMRYLMVAAAGWLIIRGARLLVSPDVFPPLRGGDGGEGDVRSFAIYPDSRTSNPIYRMVLGSVNLYLLVVMSLLVADRVLNWI